MKPEFVKGENGKNTISPAFRKYLNGLTTDYIVKNGLTDDKATRLACYTHFLRKGCGLKDVPALPVKSTTISLPNPSARKTAPAPAPAPHVDKIKVPAGVQQLANKAKNDASYEALAAKLESLTKQVSFLQANARAKK